MASSGKKIREIIDGNKGELVERIQLSVMFEAELTQRKVFQAVWLQDLKGKSRSEQINEMLAVIRVGTAQQYDGFRESLMATNQAGVLTVLPNLETDNPELEPVKTSHKVSGPRIWEPTHPKGKVVVTLSPEYSALINKNRPEVCKVLRVSELWDALRKYNVLSKGIIDDLQTEKAAQKQASALFDYLETNPVWKLHALFKSCVVEDQAHILDILGLDIQKYED